MCTEQVPGLLVAAGQGEGCRARDQHGALALAQVVAAGLPVTAGVAEHTEQVVAQLEGLAERQPDGAAGGQLGLVRIGHGRAEHEGVLDESSAPTWHG